MLRGWRLKGVIWAVLESEVLRQLDLVKGTGESWHVHLDCLLTIHALLRYFALVFFLDLHYARVGAFKSDL